ncbi:MAG: RluA family pseudouridine synthase [Bacteroidales bacterium]|nr:RluA family pseudouridine synthase [Bacteroidales bacterium]
MKYKVKDSIELFAFLQCQFPATSRSELKKILAHNIIVNGHRTSQFDFPLSPGMEVTIDRPTAREKFRNREYDLIYEDEYLLVINKHEGLLSNSKNPGDITAVTLLNHYLEATHQKCHAHIVHRLDRDTSGLMVFSKSKEVSRKFEADWKNMVYDRVYVAVAWGMIEPRIGTIRTWLMDGQYCVLSSPTDNGGKEAITHYKVVKTSRRYSLVELRLETGRRNQIRVHLREMKHPVVHDPMYGYEDDISPVSRLCLHAFRLCFFHPIKRNKMEFETPYPSTFMRLMEL